MNTSTLHIPPHLKVTQEQFEEIARANRDLRLERDSTGEIIIMPPTGGSTGKYNAKLTTCFTNWNEQTELGEVFDSSTAFRLPKGATRSPDVAWVSAERWNQLNPDEQDTFPPLCPDFALELRSKTDNLEPLRKKMQEYLDNGLRLGWLIDRKNGIVEIYRPQQPVEILEHPVNLSGENVLPGLRVDVQFLWG
jgi:Uma2 family endonuclease